MSKILWGACAASALALAYAAHAGGSSTTVELGIQGTAPAFCSILQESGKKPVFNSENDFSKVTTTTGLSVEFLSFANANGTGNELSGHATLQVNANAQCNYTLRSANGALKNAQHAEAFRAYYADAHLSSGSGSPVYLNNLTTDKHVNSFSVDAPVSGAVTSPVTIDVQIPQSGVLAAGDYHDTLSLTIEPQA